MLQDIVEQWQIMQQALAPLRLTRWQLTKMFAAQIYRDHPVGALLGISLSVVLLLWVVSVVTRPKKLEDVLGLPVLGGSRTLKSDFLRIIEEGKQRVGSILLNI